MADHKAINLPQSASYSNLPEYKDHVDQILMSYELPEGVLGELVAQIADSMWWVKTYQKDKDHLIVMKMANCLVDRNDYRIDPSESALQIFESVFKTWGGESISADEQSALDSVMASRGHNLTSLRTEAVRKSIKELEVIDRLIERQFKNMRLLMQAYESVRFAPQLLKKMTIEIQQLEQRIEVANEDQRREVSRQQGERTKVFRAPDSGGQTS